MTKLDLHRCYYDEAMRKTIRFLEKYWDQYVDLEIVTGNSSSMRAIVVKVLEEYNLDYRIGDFLGTNKGYVVVFMGR